MEKIKKTIKIMAVIISILIIIIPVVILIDFNTSYKKTRYMIAIAAKDNDFDEAEEYLDVDEISKHYYVPLYAMILTPTMEDAIKDTFNSSDLYNEITKTELFIRTIKEQNYTHNKKIKIKKKTKNKVIIETTEKYTKLVYEYRKEDNKWIVTNYYIPNFQLSELSEDE